MESLRRLSDDSWGCSGTGIGVAEHTAHRWSQLAVACKVVRASVAVHLLRTLLLLPCSM